MPIPFAQAANEYIENLILENGRNIPIKRRQLHQEIMPYFGEMPLDQIKRVQVEQFKRHLLGKGLAMSTVNRYVAVLSHLFHKAVEWEWLEKLPTKVYKYPEANIRTRYLSPDEIQKLLVTASQDPCPVIEPFIRIALGTAMRRMEILSIQIKHIDCGNREIYIPKAKCGARTQPMTGSLAEYLTHYIALYTDPAQPFLFPATRSQSGHRMEIEKPFYRVVTAAGFKHQEICRHTLRHTAITHLVQAGVDLPTVQRFSGHKSIHMVFRYSHQSKDHLHQALDQLDSRLSKGR
ncbi:MAG: tyrosine-type recombinase/integrase [Cyanobacteria bacterium]|nr:tyrosine-type recombinase/integrase [Cyanobacteriota bacterium]